VIFTGHLRRSDVRTCARVETTWDDLTSTRHDRRAEKDGVGVTFATYQPVCDCGGEFCPGDAGHRLDENVLEVTALGLDLDKRLVDGVQADIDPATAQAALDRLAALGVRSWVYSTHSATADRPSCRAIVALSRPVARADWRRFWRAAIAHLGIFVQTTCQNEARFWYLPSAPEGADVLNVSLPGEPLDVDAILAAVPAPTVSSEKPLQPAENRSETDPRVLDRVRQILAAHGPAIEGQEGDTHTLRAGYICRDHGLDEDQALEALLDWNTTCQPPWDEGDLTRKVAHAYRYAKGEEGAALLDLAVVAAVEAAAGPFVETPSPAPAPSTWYGRDAAIRLIRERANEPWISVGVAGKQVEEVRAGGTVTLQGPTGAGKTSLVCEMLLHHCDNKGYALVLSAELTADEFFARMIGIRAGVYWKAVLRGEVQDNAMREALPERVLVADGAGAHLDGLDTALGVLRADVGPTETILVAVDYGQIVDAPGDGVRDKVAAVWRTLNDIGRRHRAVILVLSQMSRAASKAARSGERLGAEAVDGGAESAAIERWSTLVLEIGAVGDEDAEGRREVSLSLAKGRMSGGDMVLPMTYEGRTGRWRVQGDARSAAEVKAEVRERVEGEKADRDDAAVFAAVLAGEPRVKETIRLSAISGAHGKVSAARIVASLDRLVHDGRLRVEPTLHPVTQQWVKVYVPMHAQPNTPTAV
jgi:hypothetical protein